MMRTNYTLINRLEKCYEKHIKQAKSSSGLKLSGKLRLCRRINNEIECLKLEENRKIYVKYIK